MHFGHTPIYTPQSAALLTARVVDAVIIILFSIFALSSPRVVLRKKTCFANGAGRVRMTVRRFFFRIFCRDIPSPRPFRDLTENPSFHTRPNALHHSHERVCLNQLQQVGFVRESRVYTPLSPPLCLIFRRMHTNSRLVPDRISFNRGDCRSTPLSALLSTPPSKYIPTPNS